VLNFQEYNSITEPSSWLLTVSTADKVDVLDVWPDF